MVWPEQRAALAGVFALLALSAACRAQPARPGGLTGGAVARPPEQGLPIKQVRIEGNQLVSEAFIRAQLHTRPGQPYDEAVVQEDIRRLLQTRRFDSAFATKQLVDG
ncbi:MAG: POTRA domain-containing protein, partial [Phycisphaerae bacterium]